MSELAIPSPVLDRAETSPEARLRIDIDMGEPPAPTVAAPTVAASDVPGLAVALPALHIEHGRWAATHSGRAERRRFVASILVALVSHAALAVFLVDGSDDIHGSGGTEIGAISVSIVSSAVLEATDVTTTEAVAASAAVSASDGPPREAPPSPDETTSAAAPERAPAPEEPSEVPPPPLKEVEVAVSQAPPEPKTAPAAPSPVSRLPEPSPAAPAEPAVDTADDLPRPPELALAPPEPAPDAVTFAAGEAPPTAPLVAEATVPPQRTEPLVDPESETARPDETTAVEALSKPPPTPARNLDKKPRPEPRPETEVAAARSKAAAAAVAGGGAPASIARTGTAARASGPVGASPGVVDEYARRVVQRLGRRLRREIARERVADSSRGRVTGTVRIGFVVAPSGAVERAHIAASSGRTVLDTAALAAVRRIDFPPTPPGMTASQRSYVVPVHFR